MAVKRSPWMCSGFVIRCALCPAHAHFSAGAQAALDLPESLTWLWRDYDPDKPSEVYEQEEAERAKPLYRVQVVNRDVW